MLGKTFAAVVIAAFIAVVPTAAYAATPTPTPGYTPGQQTVPSLDGTFVGTRCIGGIPYIGFNIVLNDPSDLVEPPKEATLIMSGGGNTHAIELGTLNADDTLSGVILWPGASVDPPGWPGWETVNGELVPTTGNFAWTRGSITAVISVNPEQTVPLSYPPETSGCADPPGGENDSPLAVTGSDFEPAPLLLAGGALVVLGGLAVVLVGRRAARRH